MVRAVCLRSRQELCIYECLKSPLGANGFLNGPKVPWLRWAKGFLKTERRLRRAEMKPFLSLFFSSLPPLSLHLSSSFRCSPNHNCNCALSMVINIHVKQHQAGEHAYGIRGLPSHHQYVAGHNPCYHLAVGYTHPGVHPAATNTHPSHHLLLTRVKNIFLTSFFSLSLFSPSFPLLFCLFFSLQEI